MVVECLNGLLGCIHTIVGWLHKLSSAFLLLDVLLDWGSGLIVCHIEGWFEVLLFQLYEHLTKSFNDGVVCDVFYWDCKDVVSVIIIGDKIILMAI